MRDEVVFFVNGAEHRVGDDRVFQTLSRFLRYDQGATGTKIVCEEGDCGACTVLIGRRDQSGLRYVPVNSCIQFLFQLDATHVVTVEGLSKRGLTPLQDAMVRCHGAQCGYCTPGFIMAMAALYEKPRLSALGSQEVRTALTGNLCRCTGYEPIIKAALEVKDQPPIDELFPPDPIVRALPDDAVRIGKFAKPSTLEEAIEFKAANPKCVIVQGATDFGVWFNKRGFVAEALLSLEGIEGLDELRVDDGELLVGGRTTLAALEEFAAGSMPELAHILDRFGSPQIKNAGTLAGNIANASPIADTLPFLYVTGARLELTGRGSVVRIVPIESFYRGYKTLDLREDEIITRIRIPVPAESDTLRLYKVSKRSHLDISSFTAAMLMRRRGDRIESTRIAYGGVGPVVLRLPKTEQFLAGRPFSLQTFEEAEPIARDEITPISDVRGSRDFRLQLAGNILKKFYYEARP